MKGRFTDMKKRIGDALDGHGFEVKETGRRTWRIGHDGTTRREVDVRLSDRWLCFRESLWGMPDKEECWAFVRDNPFAKGWGKVAVDPSDGTARLCEEVPVSDGIDLSQACRDAVSGFATAHTELSDPKKAAARRARDTAKNVSDNGEPPAGTRDTLEDLCVETGWEWSQRGDGSPVVGLDVPFGVRQAPLDASSENDYRITVELNRFKSPSGVVRSAVAVFLLTANDLIHFARGGVDETDKGVKTFLEVRFCERPSPVLFDEALCALSVGVRFCDRELRALGDERVARNYLRIRGWSPNGQDPSRGRVSGKNPGGKEEDGYVSVKV